MKKLNLILAGMFLLACGTRAMAHPGGLDEDGGHMDSKAGKYHFHKDIKGSKLDSPVEVAQHVKGEKYEGGGKVSKAEAKDDAKVEKKAKKAKKEKAAAAEDKKAAKEEVKKAGDKAEVKEAKKGKDEAKAEKKGKKAKKDKKEKK